MEKIIIKKKREFGEIIEDAIKLYLRNFKRIVPGVLKVGLIPYILVVGASLLFLPALQNFIPGSKGAFATPQILQLAAATSGLMIAVMIAVFISQIFIYSYVFKWAEDYSNTDDLQAATLGEDYQSNVKIVLGTTLKLIALGIAFFIATLLITMLLGLLLGTFAGILYLPIFGFAMYYSIIISFIFYVRVNEKISFSSAITRCQDIIKGHWWQTFFLIIVTALIGMVVNYAFSIPFGIISGAGSLLGLTSLQPILLVAQTLLSNITTLIIMPFSIFVIIMQYYNLTEYQDGTTLDKMVDNFDNIEDDFFENEGDF